MAGTIIDQAKGVTPQTPTPVTGFGGFGSAPVTQYNRAVNITEREREEATRRESLGAAVKSWSTTRVFDWFNQPKFAVEEGFQPSEYINQLSFAPTLKEERHLAESKSPEEFEYRRDYILETRKNAELMGDNPFTSFVVSMVDPGQLVLDSLTFGGARALKLGRLGAAAAAGTGTAALEGMASLQVPLEPSDILVASLVNASAVGALYRRPKGDVSEDRVFNNANLKTAENLHKVDIPNTVKVEPDGNLRVTPTAHKVTDSVGNVATTNKVVRETSERIKSNPTPPPRSSESVWAVAYGELRDHFPKPTRAEVKALETLIDKVGSIVDDVKVKRVSSGVSHYDAATKTISLNRNASLGDFTHEFAHAATADKLLYGQLNPNTAHGKLYRELRNQVKDIRDRLPKEMFESLDAKSKYFLGDGVKSPDHVPHEFVAGLFSGNKKFLETLAALPESGPFPQRTALQKVWDTVRKLLGLNPDEANTLKRALHTVDELLETPLPKKEGADMSLHDFLTKDIGVDTTFEMAVESVSRNADSWAAKLGRGVAWNLNKTMRNIGSPEITDLLTSNPLDPSSVSASSIQRAIKADLDRVVYACEDTQRQILADRGIEHWQLITKGGKEAQDQLDYELAKELVRRENRSRYERPLEIDPENPVHDLANKFEAIMEASLKAEIDAGVAGALDIHAPIRGYFPRSFNPTRVSDFLDKFGGDKYLFAKEFSKSLRNPNLTDKEATAMAGAILDRAIRRGDMTDTAFRGHSGKDLVHEVQDFLRRQDLGEESIDRITGLLEGRIDEAGKASRFKNRMDIDMTAELTAPDGTVWTPLDIMNYDMNRLADVRVHQASGSAALAHQGLVSPTEIARVREEYILSANPKDRQKAAYLFDNTMDVIHGHPVGEDMANGMRIMSAVTQMVGLAYSGLWQVTEYAKLGMRYGLLRTTREVIKELPGLRKVIDKESTNLVNVLARNAHQDLRIRPLLRRMEDGHTMDTSQGVLQNLQFMKQAVPYLNGMVFVQRHQARVNANLMLDSIQRAANGDAKALTVLRKYGVTDDVVNTIKGEIDTHGIEISNWSDGAWEAVRAPLTTMVDDMVLRSRLGEIPAYAQFTQLGRFIFTFRSFVLGAHNKILASTLVNDGAKAYATMMAYQLPLTAMMTQAQSVIAGKGYIDDPMEWAEASLAQAGGLGLFADAAGVFMGDKDQFGAPGLIAVDRGFRVLSNVPDLLQGEVGGFSKSVIDATPLLSVVPFTKGLHILWR